MNNDKKLKEYWPAGSEKWYPDACRFLDYPRNPFEKYFLEVIKPEDRVLDLGCGYGLSSLYLAGLCREVWALDPSPKAISWLEAESRQQGVSNIRTVCERFPTKTVPVCDVVVAFYVNALIRSLKLTSSLLEYTGREGLLLASHAANDKSIIADICIRLNLPRQKSTCRNGCYVVGLMEALGVKVKCQMVAHDFGQPLDSLDDATDFILWQLHLNNDFRPQIKAIAADYVVQKNGRYYMEIIRTSCLIHYQK